MVGGELRAGKCGWQMAPRGEGLPVILFANRPERESPALPPPPAAPVQAELQELPHLIKVLQSQRRPAARRGE